MATFPVFNSTKNITPILAQPVRDEAAKPFQDQQKVIGSVQELTQKISDANDVVQLNEAKAKHELALADIKSRAAADPDFTNAPKYRQELEQAKNSSLQGITNKGMMERVLPEFNLNNGIADIEINSDFNKKRHQYGQVTAKTAIDALMQKKLASTNDGARQQYDNEITNLLRENIKTGVFTYKEADDMMKDAEKTSVQYEIYNDPSTQESDSKLLKELRDPKGKYSYLPPDTRLSLVEESQRRVFQNNQTFKREVETSQNQRNIGMIDKIASGTATFKDLDNENAVPEEKGGIKRSILLQYQKYLQAGTEKTLNEYLREKNDNTKQATRRAQLAKQYNDLIESYLDDKTDQWKAKESLAKALADGVIDAKEQQTLYPLKDSLNDIKFNRDASPVAWAVKEVKRFMNASNASDEQIAVRIKQLLGGIADGAQPQAQMLNVMSAEMLKHFPDYQTYPTKGKKKMDKSSGRAYIVYPDGKWEWATNEQ